MSIINIIIIRPIIIIIIPTIIIIIIRPIIIIIIILLLLLYTYVAAHLSRAFVKQSPHCFHFHQNLDICSTDKIDF